MKLRVWYIPQVPGQPFKVEVSTLEDAALAWKTILGLSAFEFDQNIKPDYTDAIGLEEFIDGEWLEWEDPETGDDFSDYLENATE